MKKKIISLLIISTLLVGCGKVPKLQNGQDAIVEFKNGHKISVDDFYEKIKKEHGLETLVTMIDDYVLTKTFPDYEKTAKEKADGQINMLRTGYDSESEFLKAVQNYTGYATIEEYRDYIALSFYQKYAAEQYAKENLTDKEINDYYKNEIKEDIEISHILIAPDVTSEMNDEEKKKAEKDALNTANDIIKTLKNTKAADLTNKFKELVEKYSEDDATKKKDGSLGKINTTTLGSTYQPLVDAAYKIKDGTIYTEAIKTTLGYHIILRTKSYDKAELKDVKDKIVETLVEEKINDDKTIAVNAVQHYRKELGMNITDSDLNTYFNNYITNSLSNALNSK